MAGGSFEVQNKVRPGAYINFIAVPGPTSQVGSRGVVAAPLATGWGDEIIELLSTDLVDGSSILKIGVQAVDAASLVYRLVLGHTYKLIIARTDLDGAAKATATIDDITVKARYAGSFGNRLSIIIAAVTGTPGTYDVTTALDAKGKHTQRITSLAQLSANDWVTFETSGSIIPIVAATALTGGVDGVESSSSMGDALSALAKLRFNTLAVMSDDPLVKAQAIGTIKQLREREGEKCQAVLYDAGGLSGADDEGVISCKQGYIAQAFEVTPLQFVMQVAGLTAGANLAQSNTRQVIADAIKITGKPETNEEIIEALQQGWFVLSYRADGVVVVEKDINTLCNDFTDKSYAFSKNAVLRTLDEIGNAVQLAWDKTYCGKIINDSLGRDIFRGDLINYFNQLQGLRAIQDFDPDTDINVVRGESIDSVVVNFSVHPTDAMERLYMTVNVHS